MNTAEESGAMDADAVDAVALEAKIKRAFGDLAIDKRRMPASKLQSRGVPGYVGEWVLDTIVPGDGDLSAADAAKVGEWATRYIPKPDEGNLIRNQMLSGRSVKILTPVQVDVILNRKREDRIAKMPMVGLHDAHISDELVEKYPALLKQGMWGVVELLKIADGPAITAFKPMQASVSLEGWKEARRQFSLDEWRALLLLSMGYNPQAFTTGEALLLLTRLLPLVQKNMHLLELAPKGTGKSYVYENISPQVRLVSGGNISPAVLFVNNATGQPGILARYAVVVLDEVQTLKFEKPEEIVGSLKGYLANSRIARGGLHEMASDCGFVMLANITLDAAQRPAKDPLISELPRFLRETAFLDRLRGLVPGWQVRKLSGGSFAQGSGLKADYFGDVLIAMRHDLDADALCARRIELMGERPYRRNEEAVRALASGFFKLLFPHGEASDDQFYRYCVKPAVRLRQGIWDQLYALDAEYRQFEHDLKCRLV
jgi:ATP-dependent Lon protease